jgi:1-acyl-sn-glycerol-3-phosphate acyltransferase
MLQRLFFLVVVRPFLVLFIGLRVRNREQLPARGPFLIVANHTSHLDTVSLLSLFPLSRLREVRPVAAADYFAPNRFVALLSDTFFNILPIVRRREEITEANDPRRLMRDALEAGSSLILFPEGTRRSTAEEVGRFKSGVADVLQGRPGTLVVPCYLVNMGRSLPKGEWVPVPIFCEVRIGRPRTFSGTRDEVLRALEEAVRELKDAGAPARP